MELLEKKRKILHGFNDLLNMFREIESIGVEMKEMEVGNSRWFINIRECGMVMHLVASVCLYVRLSVLFMF